jgi:hypothetical protein
MPISEFLSQAYEPAEVDLMQRASDCAWKQLGNSTHGQEKDGAVRDRLGKPECATKSGYGAPPFIS